MKLIWNADEKLVAIAEFLADFRWRQSYKMRFIQRKDSPWGDPRLYVACGFHVFFFVDSKPVPAAMSERF